jgi:hypothetical protein
LINTGSIHSLTKQHQPQKKRGTAIEVLVLNLTGIHTAQYSLKLTMQKWLTAFFLLLVMTGGALASLPMHTGEKECHMTGMMDCCAKAQMNSEQPEVRAAQLCCSLNCNGPGTTTPSSSFKISTQLAVVLDGIPVPRISHLQGSGLARTFSPPGYRQNLNPAYIRHLALLI